MKHDIPSLETLSRSRKRADVGLLAGDHAMAERIDGRMHFLASITRQPIDAERFDQQWTHWLSSSLQYVDATVCAFHVPNPQQTGTWSLHSLFRAIDDSDQASGPSYQTPSPPWLQSRTFAEASWLQSIVPHLASRRLQFPDEDRLPEVYIVPLKAADRVVGIVSYFAGEASLTQSDLEFCDLVGSLISGVFLKREMELAEPSRRRIEAEHHVLTEHARVGLVIIDESRRYLYANSYYGELNGLACSEIIGERVESILGELYQREICPRLDAAFSGERLSFEVRVPPSSGRVHDRCYAVTYQPHYEEGIGKCVLVVIVDVTERKSAEERKDEFLAVLGHELRNPLAGIVGGVQVLKMIEGLSPDAQEMHAVIGRQACVMQRLIDDLLDVTRITRGKVHLRLDVVDLQKLLQEIAEDHRRLIDERQLTLNLRLPTGRVACMGDATRLTQVFGNLLQNAMKFTERGGQIGLELDVDKHHAKVTVSDTGIGMAPSLLASIFEPFMQGIQTAERGGLGLGLALVNGLVRLHNGTVRACSAGQGCGSQFIVSLPIAAEAPQAVEAKISVGSNESFKILLVDDRRDAILPAQTLLKRDGHEVTSVLDGESALIAIQEFAPDIVLCDIGLPGMSGMEVARRLRQLPNGQHIYLAALSGFAQEGDRRQAELAGFDLHLSKPISLEKLRQVVQLAREKRRDQYQ